MAKYKTEETTETLIYILDTLDNIEGAKNTLDGELKQNIIDVLEALVTGTKRYAEYLIGEWEP